MNHTVVLPICNYMEDVMVSGENRLAFLQHNAKALLLMSKEKQKDPAVLIMYEKLISLLSQTSTSIEAKAANLKTNAGRMIKQMEGDVMSVDQEPVKKFKHLTGALFKPFNLFHLLVKHFVLYVQDVLPTLTYLTPFTVNSVTITMGFIGQLVLIDDDFTSYGVTSSTNNPHFLSSLNQLLCKWPCKLQD